MNEGIMRQTTPTLQFPNQIGVVVVVNVSTIQTIDDMIVEVLTMLMDLRPQPSHPSVQPHIVPSLKLCLKN